MVKPKKNKKGNRLFTPKEIMKIDRIYSLVKENGYTLDGAKKAMRKGAETIETNHQVIQEQDNSAVISRLESIKSRLIDLKS